MTRNICIQSFSFWCEVVMVGRAVVCVLTTKGEYGVKTVIKTLKNELEFTMARLAAPLSTVLQGTISELRSVIIIVDCSFKSSYEESCGIGFYNLE
ncbi:putative (S)-2-hydroxy-acid oxidase [Helianthus anomalus]